MIASDGVQDTAGERILEKSPISIAAVMCAVFLYVLEEFCFFISKTDYIC